MDSRSSLCNFKFAVNSFTPLRLRISFLKICKQIFNVFPFRLDPYSICLVRTHIANSISHFSEFNFLFFIFIHEVNICDDRTDRDACPPFFDNSPSFYNRIRSLSLSVAEDHERTATEATSSSPDKQPLRMIKRRN